MQVHVLPKLSDEGRQRSRLVLWVGHRLRRELPVVRRKHKGHDVCLQSRDAGDRLFRIVAWGTHELWADVLAALYSNDAPVQLPFSTKPSS